MLSLLLAPTPATASSIELGIRAEAMLFELELGPAGQAGGDIELGYVPDLLEGRFRLALVWGMAGISISRSGEDARLYSPKGHVPIPEYSGCIALHTVNLSFELAVRFLNASRRVSPYIAWRPRLMLMRTVTEATVADFDLGQVQEWGWFLTAEGGLGVEFRAGKGRFFLEGAAGLFPLRNSTVGDLTSLSVTLYIGYRHLFSLVTRAEE